MSERKQHSPGRPAVTVSRTSAGEWNVSGENGGRGGLFRDEKSAFRFVRREFGASATIVIKGSPGTAGQPLPPTRARPPHEIQAASSSDTHATPEGMSSVSNVSKMIPAAKSSVFASMESNVQSYARNFPKLFDKARGTEVWDKSGRRYLDFLAGAGSLNYGHNNPHLKEALLNYVAQDGITHSLDLHTSAKEAFLEAMRDVILTPRKLDYVVQFTGPTGANAVEAALKLARKVTGRTNVIGFTNAFHGVSGGGLSVTGGQYFRQSAGLPLWGVTHMPFEGYHGEGVDTIACIERLLDDPSSGIDHPAAVIVETVQGEGGLNAASAEWLRRLHQLCQLRNIILIVDDIQAGCGRTGDFFSFEAAGLKPDIVTLSKSLSGYGLPMSVVLIRRDLDAWRPGQHNGTFRGNNHAFVTATAALRHYWSTPDFATELADKSQDLRLRLQRIQKTFPADVAEVRGRGLMQGLRFHDPERAARVTAAAFQDGVIIERAGPRDEVVKFMMPLTTTRAELDEGLDIVERALAKVTTERRDDSAKVPVGIPAAE
jgi:diaminobutyrate-2-oxoglutarate transaminase